jgi:hypothetical protein
MTDYSAWDSKASALLRETEKQEAEEKANNDKACGLENGPQGPPTWKVESEMKDLCEHSEERKQFIKWSRGCEVTISHQPQDGIVQLNVSDMMDKAVRISNSEGVTYVIGEGSKVIKLTLDNCKRVRMRVLTSIITSTIEACRCEDVDLELAVPIGTIQVDECAKPLRILFAEQDHFGKIYHQNSPGLTVGWGSDVNHLQSIGQPGKFQLFTVLRDAELLTAVVRRGEGELPLDLLESAEKAERPESEAVLSEDERKRNSDAKRTKGNDMFKANDFLQAVMEYTGALELDPTIAAVWANRAQCWLKLGDYEKALADAKKATEVDSSNAKGWFRQGMAFHAMHQYADAIRVLLEAEKLDPANKQIPEAIRMAQLMARKQASM